MCVCVFVPCAYVCVSSLFGIIIMLVIYVDRVRILQLYVAVYLHSDLLCADFLISGGL